MSDSDLQMTSAEEKTDEAMQALLERYLPGRRPVSIDDYDWRQIRPGAVDHDILEALSFVTLVESNPEAPAQVLLAAADRGNAPWLRRFIQQTWLPEERMHHVPYREYLIRSGAYQVAEIDSEIDKVRARGFIYGQGYTPLQSATYGWLQELLTWHFYEAMGSYLRIGDGRGSPGDPVLAKIVGDIAKQENFHRYVYLSGAKTVLKYAPHRKSEVINTVAEFLMPGHHMAPELQPKAPAWALKFNLSFRKLFHEICATLVDLIGYKGLGQTAVLYGTLHQIPWYFKVPGTVLTPLSKPYHSPVNHLIGRLLTLHCRKIDESGSRFNA